MECLSIGTVAPTKRSADSLASESSLIVFSLEHDIGATDATAATRIAGTYLIRAFFAGCSSGTSVEPGESHSRRAGSH